MLSWVGLLCVSVVLIDHTHLFFSNQDPNCLTLKSCSKSFFSNRSILTGKKEHQTTKNT